jgi:sigma-E factor negative regulatory protein RseB
MVPLRRELFDTSENVISEDSFVQVRFGALASSQFAAADASAAQSLTTVQAGREPAWVAAATPARFVASLAGQGWRVPGSVPGGLPLYAAAWAQSTTGEVVDLEYSDGLYVVSLFVQRGTLAANMAGWRPVDVAGQQAFVSGHSVTWSGLGFVYTMIADAPPQTMSQVVGALPRGASPGVLSRLGRGFIRLAHMIDPFG